MNSKSPKKKSSIFTRIKQTIIKIEKIESKIKEYSRSLENNNLYIEDKEKFFTTTKIIEDLNKKLFELESKWKELEEESINESPSKL